MRRLFRFSAQAWLLGLFVLCASPVLWSCNKSVDNSANDASFIWSTNLLLDNMVLLRKQVL